MEIVSDSVIETPDIGMILPVYIDLIFRTEEFLAMLLDKDGIEYSYETKVWFGTPSLIRIIIYK